MISKLLVAVLMALIIAPVTSENVTEAEVEKAAKCVLDVAEKYKAPTDAEELKKHNKEKGCEAANALLACTPSSKKEECDKAKKDAQTKYDANKKLDSTLPDCTFKCLSEEDEKVAKCLLDVQNKYKAPTDADAEELKKHYKETGCESTNAVLACTPSSQKEECDKAIKDAQTSYDARKKLDTTLPDCTFKCSALSTTPAILLLIALPLMANQCWRFASTTTIDGQSH